MPKRLLEAFKKGTAKQKYYNEDHTFVENNLQTTCMRL
jgi:hypothetical protein